MAAPSVTWLLLPAVVLPPALKASELWPSTSYWDWMAGKDGNGYTYIIYIYTYEINTGHDLMRISDP